MNKILTFIKNNYIFIILFIAIIGFLALTSNVLNEELIKGDTIGYNLISKYLISDHITPIAKVITYLGDATILIIMGLILFIIIKNKKISLSILANLIIVTSLNLLLKGSLQRPRPTEFNIINETGYSFPSGHAMISLAFYGYLIYLIFKKIKQKYIKWPLIILLSLLIILIGITRIYFGVHYTSDVIGGYLISISYLILYISLLKKVGVLNEK